MNYPHVEYFDYKLFGGKLSNIYTERKQVINTINQYSFCIAEKDVAFKNALLASDILLPDGIGVVWSSSYINKNKIQKIAGADLHEFLLEKLNREHGKCFYLGSTDSTLEKIKQRINKEYPNITFSSFSPPYKNEFSVDESLEMVIRVNEFQPDVLFVGMTAPKQEKWVNEYRHSLDANLICSVGAVFDFYAGTVKRPNHIWIGLGLEWLGRFISEPKRMWKRYLYYGPVFLMKTVLQKNSKDSGYEYEYGTTALSEKSKKLVP